MLTDKYFISNYIFCNKCAYRYILLWQHSAVEVSRQETQLESLTHHGPLMGRLLLSPSLLPPLDGWASDFFPNADEVRKKNI